MLEFSPNESVVFVPFGDVFRGDVTVHNPGGSFVIFKVSRVAAVCVLPGCGAARLLGCGGARLSPSCRPCFSCLRLSSSFFAFADQDEQG